MNIEPDGTRTADRVMAPAAPVVLVVDDDGSMREAIGRLLGAAGFRPVVCGSAEEALSESAGGQPACVVSDLRLPGMSGLELLDELRTMGQRSPVIVITAYDTAGLRDEAVRRGAADYLVKPFRGSGLLDAIRAAIDSAGAP